jgi:CubicO group peptidase (beta-lactamase class C family)
MLLPRMPSVGLLFFLLIAGSVGAAPVESKNSEAKQPLEWALGRIAEAGESWPRLHSLLISRHGELIYERYFNGHGPHQLENVKSVSKSILSALIGIAIERGNLSGLDTTLDDYFAAEMTQLENAEKRGISLHNLLTMQSGLRSTSNTNYAEWIAQDDWVDAVLRSPMEATPGHEMIYSTGNSHLLSAILTRATGRSTLEYAREVLSQPLGFDLAPWPRDPKGIYFGGNDMELTPRQLLAIGELYLNGGRSGDRQIIPADWVQDSLQPHVASQPGESRYYGFGWWFARLMGHDVPHAWGHGGQFVMLVPDLDVVLVSTSAASPGAIAQAHANNVYGMLQLAIRSIDRHSADNDRLLAGRQ